MYILTLSCKDKIGIVAAVSSFLAENGGFILESAQFGDIPSKLFFMRTVFQFNKAPRSLKEITQDFSLLAKKFKMHWELFEEGRKPKVLVMVSKQSHCLNVILNQYSTNSLAIEIPAIVSNHKTLQNMASWYNVPFHYHPIEKEKKEKQEKQVLRLIKELHIDLVILARYMQILSPSFARKVKGKAINIHHSFLPSFKGAKPYHQAFERGVKIIGATAHYVSEDLDEGPIIEQEIAHIKDNAKATDLISIGKDVESLVLIRAVKKHIEHRVFINGNKTVVFNP